MARTGDAGGCGQLLVAQAAPRRRQRAPVVKGPRLHGHRLDAPLLLSRVLRSNDVGVLMMLGIQDVTVGRKVLQLHAACRNGASQNTHFAEFPPHVDVLHISGLASG